MKTLLLKQAKNQTKTHKNKTPNKIEDREKRFGVPVATDAALAVNKRMLMSEPCGCAVKLENALYVKKASLIEL